LLIAALPAESPDDRLRSLMQARRWDLENGELQQRVSDSVGALLATEPVTSIVALFDEEQWEAAFELGHSLAEHAPSTAVESRLAGLVDTPNSQGLAGYLHGLIDSGHAIAFDNFLDGPRGQAMSPADRLSVSVRGPESARGWSRAGELLPLMTVRDGAVGLFGWHIDVNLDRLGEIVNEWLPRISSQNDYNAAVDFIALALHRHPAPAEPIEDRVKALVDLRRAYPDLGQQSWDWTQLAKRQLETGPGDLFKSMLELIDADALHLFAPSDEARLARDAVERVGMPAWEQVMAKLRSDSWRVRWDFRGWLTDALPATDVIAWIGDDPVKARLAASVAGIGDGTPSDVVRFLLANFGTDPSVSSSLAGDLVTGSWMGNESTLWDNKINQLGAWLDSANEPEGVKRWAREMIVALRKQRDDALRREAEGGW
jgi:hypothetical protein